MQTLEKTTKIAPREGLDSTSVLESRKKYGENVLPKARGRSFLRAFFANLGDPVIKILLGALAINLIFLFKSSDVWETVGIAVSVFTGTLISTLSERGSERAYERLENDVGEGRCRVRRREGVFELPFSEVCVGDIVLLSAGDAIPADGLLISGGVSLDMSSMTGEGREVQKTVSRDTSLLPSAPASLLRGSRVTSGEGEMEVLLVGAATMLGSISREVQLEVRESPLKVRLRKLARQISRLGYVAAALVALQGGTLEQMGHACAMALKNLMGLVCDPVAGLVEVPCVKRNVGGAVNALAAADMALAGIESAIPVDQVIDAINAKIAENK